MDINSPLLHLALLESLKGREISDEIDLFLPFIAVTVSELNKAEIRPEDIQSSLDAIFGFKPPHSAIQVFMTRARKRGLFKKEHGAFIPVYAKIEEWKNSFHHKRDDIRVSFAGVFLKTIGVRPY